MALPSEGSRLQAANPPYGGLGAVTGSFSLQRWLRRAQPPTIASEGGVSGATEDASR